MVRGPLYINLWFKEDNCDEINSQAAYSLTGVPGDLEAFLGSLHRPVARLRLGMVTALRGMLVGDWEAIKISD